MSRLPLLGLFLLSLPAVAAECFIVQDRDGHTLTRQGECSTRLPPASTFKIPLSLIGYDSGLLQSETAPALPYNGTDEAFLPAWAQTTTPAHWMRYSVVWYSQHLTRALGRDRLQRYVDAFDYGNRDLSGNPGQNDGLSQAWLGSSLTISPDEQAAFIGKLLRRQLPVADAAYRHTAAILRQADIQGWQVYGKTGNARRLAADGQRYQVGWYVGWVSKGERTLGFVYNIRDEAAQPGFASQRAKAALLDKLPPLLEQAVP